MSSFSRSVETSEPREGNGGFHLLAAVHPSTGVTVRHAVAEHEVTRHRGHVGIGVEIARPVLGRQVFSRGTVSGSRGLDSPPPLVRTRARAAGVPRHVVALAGLELGGALEPLGEQHRLRGCTGGLGYFILIRRFGIHLQAPQVLLHNMALVLVTDVGRAEERRVMLVLALLGGGADVVALRGVAGVGLRVRDVQLVEGVQVVQVCERAGRAVAVVLTGKGTRVGAGGIGFSPDAVIRADAELLHISLSVVVVGFNQMSPRFPVPLVSSILQLPSPICEPIADL